MFYYQTAMLLNSIASAGTMCYPTGVTKLHPDNLLVLTMTTDIQNAAATLSISIPKRGIGYIRVSSDLQATDGHSLDRQLGRLREWCALEGWTLLTVYEDIGSAVGAENVRRRPEFEQAVREALQLGVPLLVTDATRVSRDLATLDRMVIEQGLRVISVEDGGEVPTGILRQRVQNGARQAARISEGTKQAIAKKLRRPAPHTAVRQKAARKSAEVRVDRKNQTLERLVDCFQREPWLESATSQEVADRLNALDIETSWSRRWTASAVRGKRQAIRDELIFRRELDAEDPVVSTAPAGEAFSPVSREPTMISPGTLAAGEHASGLSSEKAPQGEEAVFAHEDDDEVEMKRNPLYAMF